MRKKKILAGRPISGTIGIAMMERGVTFKLNARLADAGPGAVVLKPDEEIRDIWKLRIKLEAEPGDPVHFLTVHGAGYKFLT